MYRSRILVVLFIDSFLVLLLQLRKKFIQNMSNVNILQHNSSKWYDYWFNYGALKKGSLIDPSQLNVSSLGYMYNRKFFIGATVDGVDGVEHGVGDWKVSHSCNEEIDQSI